MSIDEKTGTSVGLDRFDCVGCTKRLQVERGCRLPGKNYKRSSVLYVDYHRPSKISLDAILFCPASIPGIHSIRQDVYDLIGIRDEGGLKEHYGLPHSQLPETLVNFYRDVCGASDRFAQEIRAEIKKES